MKARGITPSNRRIKRAGTMGTQNNKERNYQYQKKQTCNWNRRDSYSFSESSSSSSESEPESDSGYNYQKISIPQWIRIKRPSKLDSINEEEEEENDNSPSSYTNNQNSPKYLKAQRNSGISNKGNINFGIELNSAEAAFFRPRLSILGQGNREDEQKKRRKTEIAENISKKYRGSIIEIPKNNHRNSLPTNKVVRGIGEKVKERSRISNKEYSISTNPTRPRAFSVLSEEVQAMNINERRFTQIEIGTNNNNKLRALTLKNTGNLTQSMPPAQVLAEGHARGSILGSLAPVKMKNLFHNESMPARLNNPSFIRSKTLKWGDLVTPEAPELPGTKEENGELIIDKSSTLGSKAIMSPKKVLYEENKSKSGEIVEDVEDEGNESELSDEAPAVINASRRKKGGAKEWEKMDDYDKPPDRLRYIYPVQHSIVYPDDPFKIYWDVLVMV